MTVPSFVDNNSEWRIHFKRKEFVKKGVNWKGICKRMKMITEELVIEARRDKRLGGFQRLNDAFILFCHISTNKGLNKRQIEM